MIEKLRETIGRRRLGLGAGVVILLTYLSIFIHLSGGELRFCYNGPHRIRYQDCPGGFIVKMTVGASCVYYFRGEGEPDMQASYSRNVCDHTTYINLESPTEEFQNNEVQFIRFFNVDNSSVPLSSNEVKGEPDKCNEQCLGEYLEPKYWHPTPHLVDKPTIDDAKLEEAKKKYVELTKLIMIKIINEDEFDEDGEAGSKENKAQPDEIVSAESFQELPIGTNDMRVASNWSGKVDFLYESTNVGHTPMSSLLKLLAKSMRVTYKKCKPYLEPSFYTLVFRSMQELRRMAEFFPNIHGVPLKRIMKMLDKCEKAENVQFKIGGSICDGKRVIKSITNLEKNETRKYTLSPRSFRWGVYDPIVEAAWSSIQFVHGHCSTLFSDDILHFSLYVRAMSELFIQPLIQGHWIHPTEVGKGLTLWEMAYDTADIQNQMLNLDACISAAYEGSVFKERLERPFTSEEALAEPKFEDVSDKPDPGWSKSITDYWRMYKNRGFQQMVEELGICIKDPAQFSESGNNFINDVCPEVK